MFDSTIFGSQNIGVYTATAIIAIIAIVTVWSFVTSKNWETTSGKIESIEMREIHNRPSLQMSSGKSFTEYKIDVKYSYHASGKSYTGDKIYPFIPNIFPNKADAEYILTKFDKEQDATVYFNPKQPSISCLISSAGIPNKNLYRFALSALIILLIFITGIIYFNKIFSD